MKTNLILLVVLITANIVFAQKIEVKSFLGSYEFRQNEERLPWKKVKDQVSSNTNAFELLQKARNKDLELCNFRY